MDDRDLALVNLEGIQRLRDRARSLKQLLLNAGTRTAGFAPAAEVQQPHEERTSAYVEIRPRRRRLEKGS